MSGFGTEQGPQPGATVLDRIHQEQRAHDDYLQPERFFKRTYLTQSLMELSSQVVQRFSGMKVETSAVFNMATQFGGSKTHALTALYHLVKGGQAATSALIERLLRGYGRRSG